MLFGTAKDDVDPENPYNEVVSIDNTGLAFGGISVKLGHRVKVPMLDNELETKYYFVGRSCGGGAPRVQLRINVDQDRAPEGNAFGYYGPVPGGLGCPMAKWTYEDLTDELPRWDLSQFANDCAAIPGCTLPVPPPASSGYLPWTAVETFFAAVFPAHRVTNVALVDDTYPGSPSGQGCAYYDLTSLGPRTVTDWHDTVGDRPDRGFTNNC